MTPAGTGVQTTANRTGPSLPPDEPTHQPGQVANGPGPLPPNHPSRETQLLEGALGNAAAAAPDCAADAARQREKERLENFKKVFDPRFGYVSQFATVEEVIAVRRALKNPVMRFPSHLAVRGDRWLASVRVGDAGRAETLRVEQPTDEVLRQLPRFTRLANLHMSECEQLSDDALRGLSTLDNLRDVTLEEGSHLTGSGLQHLPVGIQRLALEHCYQLQASSLEHLSRLVLLETLSLRGCSRIGKTEPADALRYLSGLPELRSLNLSYTGVKDEGLRHLRLPLLQHLDLTICGALTDEGLGHVARLLQLRTLKVQFSNITDAGMRHLEQLVHLESLRLELASSISDSGLRSLLALPQLQELVITHGRSLTDNGLEHLARLGQLRTLGLTRTRISDRGLQDLQQLVNLQSLDLSHSARISDAGLGHLLALKALHTLDLSFCGGLTDAALRHLAAMDGLRVLIHSSFSEGLEQLQVERPDLEVRRN